MHEVLTRTRRTRGPLHAGRSACVAAATAIAATILVLRHLGTKPLWLDEGVSVAVASRSITQLVRVLPHRDANAGLYYLVLHVWLHFGRGAAWDRGLSAASFVGAAAAAAWVASRRWGLVAGFSAGLLLATNRFLLFYGQEARPYAPAVLLAIVAGSILWSGEGDQPGVAFVLVTSVLLYTDLFAGLFMATLSAAFALCTDATGRQALGRCWLWIVAFTSPVWLVMLTIERGQISWLARPSVHLLWSTVAEMANGPAGLVLLVGLAFMLLRGTADAGEHGDRVAVAVLGAAWLVPPVVLWAIAQVAPSFLDRYVICSALAALAIAVVGVTALAEFSRLVAFVVLGALVALGLRQDLALERQTFKYEDRPVVVTFLERDSQPADAIGFGSGGLRLIVDPGPSTLLPEDVALAPQRSSDVYAPEVSPATLLARLVSVRRVWMVTDPTDHGYPSVGAFAPIKTTVLSEFRVASTVRFPGMDVTLYVRR